VTQTLAASGAQDLVRLGELQTMLSGLMPLGQAVPANQVTGLDTVVLQLLATELEASNTVGLLLANGALAGFNVLLQPDGGLVQSSQGLGLDFTKVLAPGASFQSSDIADFASGVVTVLGNSLEDSDSIGWTIQSGVVTANVNLDPNGALLVDGNGLAVNLGPTLADDGTANQAAPGNHTHSLLHSPLTLGTSATLDLTLNGQRLSGEVALAALGGLLATASGVAVNFGTGHNQVARGDILAGALGEPLTVLSTATLALALNQSNVLSGVVRCDPNPPAGTAPLTVGANGLYLQLGTTASTAAAGNHSHNTATEDSNGFMSAADKAKLDGLGNVAYTFAPPLLLTGMQVSVQAATEYTAGSMSAADKAKLDSVDPVPLTFGAPLVLIGHAVSLPQAGPKTGGGYQSGYLSGSDWNAFNSKQAPLGFGAPLVLSAGNVTMPPAGDGQDGYLLAADWDTFNGKADAFTVNAPMSFVGTLLNFLIDGNSPLTLAGGALSLPAASESQNGYMSSTDKAKLDSITAGGTVIGGGTVGGALTFVDNLEPAIIFGGSTFGLQVDLNGGSPLFEVVYSGAPVLTLSSVDDSLTLTGNLNLPGGMGVVVNGTKVVSDQQAAVADAATITTPNPTASGYGFATAQAMNNFVGEVTGAIAQLNLLLAKLRTHGLIASS
jgi:hypothetical protein